MVQEAQERLRDQLAHTGTRKVPLDQRAAEVPDPRCPIDGVALEIVSYTDRLMPATRAFPVCRRTEREFTEKDPAVWQVAADAAGARRRKSGGGPSV
jgi:hypothetical protein